MKFKLYREFGALNSQLVFNAFEKGLRSIGHSIVNTDEDVAVIWSVLWSGRMKNNQPVYQQCRQKNIPVVILEVGNLKRGTTWRVSLNHINGLGHFGNTVDLDVTRPGKLGVSLKSRPEHTRGEILIACQHSESLQWEGMPVMRQWCEETIAKIRQHSNRRIIVRSHPRSPFTFKMANIILEKPSRVANTYDDFDIFYNYHCVVNHNSGPAVQAAMQGIPVLCDSSSLAGPLSIKWEELENPHLPNREEWFLKLCHTEWTVDEISSGVPIARLFS
jgi:hypothetical protein